MKKVFALLVAVCAVSGVFAQMPTLSAGTEQAAAFDKGSISIIGSDAAHVYVIHDNKVITGQKVELQVFDLSGNLQAKAEVIPPGSEGVMGDSKLYRTSVVGGGGVIKFSEGWLKSSKTSSYLAQMITPAGELGDYVTLDEGPAAGQMRAPHYYPEVSPDGTKLGVLTAYGFEKNTNAKVRVSMFDAKTLNKLWSKDLDLGIPSQKGKVYGFAVDNSGNAFVHRNAKIDKKVMKQMCYTTDGKKMKKYELKTERPYMNASDFGHDANGNVVFAGFCGEKNNTRYNAVYVARFDGTGTLTAEASTAAKSIETPGISGTSSLPEFKLRGIAGLENGVVAVMAENTITESKSIEGQLGVYDYTYHKGNVVVFGFAADASLAWETTVEKSSKISVRGRDAWFDSFAWGVLNGKLTMVYNVQNLGDPFTDNDGKIYKYTDTFGYYTMYPAFMDQIDASGAKSYGNLKHGKMLPSLTFNNTTSMALIGEGSAGTAQGLMLLQGTNAYSKIKVATLR